MIGVFSTQPRDFVDHVKSVVGGVPRLRMDFELNNWTHGVWKKLPYYTVCVFLGHCAKDFTTLARERGRHIIQSSVKGVYYVVVNPDKPYPVEMRALMFQRTKGFGKDEEPAITWMASRIIDLERLRIMGSVPVLQDATVNLGTRNVVVSSEQASAAFLAAYHTPEELLK